MRPVNRILPALPVAAMKTYSIDAPMGTHFRAATCVEVECVHRERGWRTLVDETTELGQRQADYIRRHAGRHFTEAREEGMTRFDFPAGQACFRTHQVRVDRPEIFSVAGGDFRGRTTEPRILPAHGWVEDMQADFDRLKTIHERG